MIISSDYLSTLTENVGSYLLNLDKAFYNLAAPSGFNGFIVTLITGSGTNIVWHLIGWLLSAWVKVSPVEHSTPKMAKMSPALTYSIYSILLACILTSRETLTFLLTESFQTNSPFFNLP